MWHYWNEGNGAQFMRSLFTRRVFTGALLGAPLVGCADEIARIRFRVILGELATVVDASASRSEGLAA